MATAVPPPPTTIPTQPPPNTPTAIPTTTAVPTLPPTIVLTVTPIGPCEQRVPADDDLLPLVTLDYGLSRDYAPGDLISLADHLPNDITLGYPTKVRRLILAPLLKMIDAMQSAGLQPLIISGYRSYSTQATAWDKWNRTHPDSAAIVSSPPGHSEHQLGTTLDFGSPELPGIVGEEKIQFHTYFYKTSEGVWLLEHAHEHGFTLSYPREGFDVTGFYYEPWHYRYVGVELATQLHENNTFLAHYLMEAKPLPCLP